MVRAITRLNIGGPARQALLLTRELAEEFPTTLVAGQAPAGEGEMADADIEVRRVSFVRPLRPLEDLRSLSQVSGLLQDLRPRLVHTHMAKAGTIGRVAAFRARPRPLTVHTFHGHVLEGYFSPPVQRLFIEIERRLARRTDALVAVSNEVKDDLLRLGIGTPQKVHVIPLGFELSPFLNAERTGAFRKELGIASDVPLAGVLGRLAPVKDHSTLLKAVARLPHLHLAVLGDGELRPSLEKDISSLGIAHRAHMVGWRTEIANCIADMDVVVLTSRNEGTPVSLIEAHACGRPAVATDVGGVRTVVNHGETGLLVPAGDDAGVSAAIRSLIEDPEARRRMGAAGREHVRHRFSKGRLIADVRALYESLLS